MSRKHVTIPLAVIAAVAIVGFASRNFIADSQVIKVDQDESLGRTIDTMMLESNGSRIKGGDFVDADVFHTATGGVAVYTTDASPILVLDDSFSVRSGPDLVVYLSRNKVASGEELGEFVSLNALKSDSGAQAYSLPDNYDEFQSVVVWCRAFDVNFGSADLQAL